MLYQLEYCLIILFITCGSSAKPLYVPTEHTPLAAGLGSRVAAHAPRLQGAQLDPRLSLPSSQDLEAIKKVAQILVMLGEQVIPALIGGSGNANSSTQPTEVPNDPVDIA